LINNTLTNYQIPDNGQNAIYVYLVSFVQMGPSIGIKHVKEKHRQIQRENGSRIWSVIPNLIKHQTLPVTEKLPVSKFYRNRTVPEINPQIHF